MSEILHITFDTLLIILMTLAAVMIVIFTVAILRAAWQTMRSKKPTPQLDIQPKVESVTKTLTKKPTAKKVAKKKTK